MSDFMKIAYELGALAAVKEASKLSTKTRNALPKSDFAEPASRSYPVENEARARNALSRVSQFGSPAEKAKVRAAVHRKYPDIGKK